MAKFDTARLAPLDAPTFTGDARAVTPAALDADTSVATTAFVTAAIAAGGGGVSVTVSATPPPSPSNGSLWYDLTTGVLSVYINDGNTLQWVQVSPVPAAAGTGALGSGRLTYVSATALSFKPYNGNQIKINGTIYTIPNAGIAGLGNTSVFVNGSTGNLAASATYWVTAFINSGTVTAHYWSGAVTHGPSTTAGNEGVEILTGADAYSLIGLIRTNASAQFIDNSANRLVASWFNRRPRALLGTGMNGVATGGTFPIDPGTTYVVYILSWGDSVVHVGAGGVQVVQNTANATNYLSIYMDTNAVTIANNGTTCTTANVGYYLNAIGVFDAPSEGFHSLGFLLGVTGGIGTYYGTLHGSVFI